MNSSVSQSESAMAPPATYSIPVPDWAIDAAALLDGDDFADRNLPESVRVGTAKMLKEMDVKLDIFIEEHAKVNRALEQDIANVCQKVTKGREELAVESSRLNKSERTMQNLRKTLAEVTNIGAELKENVKTNKKHAEYLIQTLPKYEAKANILQ